MPVDNQLEEGIVIVPANTVSSQNVETDMARRRYQKGSLFLRGKRNVVWVGRWYEDSINEAGQVHRIYKKEVLGSKKDFPTRKLALRELEMRVSPINSPTYRAVRSDTFARFAEWWKDNMLINKNYKPSTRSVIKSQLRTQLVPFFGRYAMKDITWHLMVAFVNGCTKSPKTCRNYILTLKMMWKVAKVGGWASHNPFDGLVLPKVPECSPFFYTADEAKRIIAAADGQFRTLYWLAAETGIRPGEVCGLRLHNLELAQSQIRITHSVWRGEFQEPKTKNAKRTIAISEGLAAHLLEFLEHWRPNAATLLFSSTSGGPLHPSSVRRDKLGPLCERLGIQAKGLNAFRHCSATIMDQIGTPSKVRQERLGHAPGSKVTQVHYTHAVAGDARLAATAVGQMLVN